jgi:hypothetical protein
MPATPSVPKTGTKPATVTELTDHPEGNRGGDCEVDAAPDETTDLETGPAAEDLAQGEVEEVTVDADEAVAPSDPGAEDLVWNAPMSTRVRLSLRWGIVRRAAAGSRTSRPLRGRPCRAAP